MATTVVFNEDSKDARQRMVVDEEPADVAAALEKTAIPQLTSRGDPVWINSSSVRLLLGRGGGQAEGAEAAGAEATKKPA